MEKRELTKEELVLEIEKANRIIARLQARIGNQEGYIARLETENEIYVSYVNQKEKGEKPKKEKKDKKEVN